MTTMNRVKYLQGRWKFSEDKVNVIARAWSPAASAAYSSNSFASISTWIRETSICFISYTILTFKLRLCLHHHSHHSEQILNLHLKL